MVNNTSPKRRNSEKKKEKSRFAARCRRSKESEIFNQLAETLPLPKSVVSQLDKASIMRLVISCLKVVRAMDTPRSVLVKKEKNDQDNLDHLLLKALEGFLLVLSCDGDMVYLSENVNRYLGLAQIDLMGHSIFEFSHPCDHDEIKEMLSLKCSGKSIPSPSSLARSFFFRMKCTLTTKGKNVNLKSASYKVIHCIGKMMKQKPLKLRTSENELDDHCLVAVGQPIVHPSNIEVPLDKQTFLTQHDLDMKFTYVDDKICEILGYHKSDLLNKSVYQLHHLEDSQELAKSYKTLFSVGQCETGRYRFLAKRGGYAWVLTQATLIYVDKTQKPNCVVCINYFLSGVENEHEVISEHQLNAELERVAPKAVDDDSSSNLDDLALQYKATSKKSQEPTAPSSCTQKIFAPFTEDMSKGFLMPSGDIGGLSYKEEPEDLTHLAPTAGEECIPLDFSGFYEDDVRLPENFFDVTSIDYLTTVKDEHQSSEKSMAFARLDNDPFLFNQDSTGVLDLNGDRLFPKDRSDTSSDLSSLKSMSPSELVLGEEISSPESFPMVCHMAHLDLGLPSGALLSEHSLDNEESASLESIDGLSVSSVKDESSWDGLLKNGDTSLRYHKESSNLAKLLKSDRQDIMSESRLLDSLLRRSETKTNNNYTRGIKYSTINDDELKHLNASKMMRSKLSSKEISRKSDSLVSNESQSKRLLSDDLTCTKKPRIMCDNVPNYMSQSSVLLNLLKNGKDDSHGYSCLNGYKPPYLKNGELPSYRSPVSPAEKPSFNNQPQFPQMKSEGNAYEGKNSKITLELLGSEMPPMSALLSLTQHDMDVNAPVQSSRNLLQGHDLLLALDQTTNGFA